MADLLQALSDAEILMIHRGMLLEAEYIDGYGFAATFSRGDAAFGTGKGPSLMDAIREAAHETKEEGV
jgi:hypothetical protein